MIFNLIQYLLEGIIVIIISYIIPKKKIKLYELTFIGILSAIIFYIMDLYIPILGKITRSGLGFMLINFK